MDANLSESESDISHDKKVISQSYQHKGYQMKVITNCAAAVVGSTVFHEHPIYKIPDDGTDAERLGAFAAKGCYASWGEDGRSCVANQKQILEHAHGSVLEHSSVSLFIEGITRALSLELNRHRPFSISQLSTRYVKEEDCAMVLEPFYADIWRRYGLSLNEKTNELIVPKQYQAGDSSSKPHGFPMRGGEHF